MGYFIVAMFIYLVITDLNVFFFGGEDYDQRSDRLLWRSRWTKR